MLVVAVVGCDSATVETPEEVVAAAIDRHGGSTFDRVSIRWEFRGTPFGLDRDGGRYRYQRLFLDEPDMTLYQVMENDGTWSELNGARQELDTPTRNVVESEINSTVYLGFLPFRLDDESVRLADLGTADLEGRTYRKIEATFTEEGGGRGWRNRFVYWFLEGDWTLDYLAYWEPTTPPTTRFRRAVNRREVGGLLIQDYENYAATGPAAESADFDIADYDRLFESDQVSLLSMVEFDEVEVSDTPVFPER